MLTVNGQVLREVHIRRGIIQGNSLSQLLFVIAMLPLTIILRKNRTGIPTTKDMAAKISLLLYMNDLKAYSPTETELKSLLNTVRIISNNINMEFGVEKCAIFTIHRGEDKHKPLIYLTKKQTNP